MSMVVKNNMSAVTTLNTLNKNSSALQKSLQKVSSGMKINSAKDDASGYAISERMRVQIRSLDQANQNTQNAASMIKTAEGAVSSTLDLVRTMKEKAINSANDTNTDSDRLTIQKEMNQFIDQVDDNALVTFNGKMLLDGSSMPMHNHEYTDEQNILRGLNSAWIADSLDLIKDSYGVDFTQNGNVAKAIQVKFVGGDTGVAVPSGKVEATAWCGYDGTTGLDTLTLTFNMDKVTGLDPKSQDGYYTGQNANLDRTVVHELTHGIMFSKYGDKMGVGSSTDKLPNYVIEGGTAELVHGADDRDDRGGLATGVETVYNVFKNNASSTSASAPDAVTSTQSNGLAEYSGGYAAMRYFAAASNIEPRQALKNFFNALDNGASVDDAFKIGSSGKFENRKAFEDAFVKAYEDAGGSGSAFVANYLNTNNEDTGSITGSDAGGKVPKTAKSVVHEVGSTVNWRLPSSTSTMIGGLEVIWPAGMNTSSSAGGSTVYQVGASANQSINVGFNDMRARSIGLYDEDENKLDVTTQGKARAAISTLDKIVNLVVDQQTNIGAMLQRLDYTSANLTTSSENVQKAESTIRDSDMAKEMTSYTKNNVLMQAAQSMLAQANQSSSAVLSLLQ